MGAGDGGASPDGGRVVAPPLVQSPRAPMVQYGMLACTAASLIKTPPRHRMALAVDGDGGATLPGGSADQLTGRSTCDTNGSPHWLPLSHARRPHHGVRVNDTTAEQL